MYRTTWKENDYHKYRSSEKECYFCNPEAKVIKRKYKFFYVMKNNYSYDFWDGQDTKEHLLIVFKKHSSYLNDKETKVFQEYGKLLNKFNKSGYDIFTRTSGSPSRSQMHFHTHFIKTSGKKFKGLTYKKDPYKLTIKF